MMAEVRTTSTARQITDRYLLGLERRHGGHVIAFDLVAAGGNDAKNLSVRIPSGQHCGFSIRAEVSRARGGGRPAVPIGGVAPATRRKSPRADPLMRASDQYASGRQHHRSDLAAVVDDNQVRPAHLIP